MRTKLASLNCLMRKGNREDLHAVILHGFGADASDLFPLAEALDSSGDWNFYFPDAPLEVPIGGGFVGRGWFPISLRSLESGVDFSQIRPPGLDSSKQAIESLIFELDLKSDQDTLVLGGFSQGAMVATDVALDQPEALKGLIVLSGTLLDQVNWQKNMRNLSGLKILQSHGEHDQVLPISMAQKLAQQFKSIEPTSEFVQFPGGHEIPAIVLRKAASLFQQLRG